MDEISARGVGRQMWRCEEIADRKGEVGSQWSGKELDMRCNSGGGMVYDLVNLSSEYALSGVAPEAIGDNAGWDGWSGEATHGSRGL